MRSTVEHKGDEQRSGVHDGMELREQHDAPAQPQLLFQREG
jgi:hypothetical protein